MDYNTLAKELLRIRAEMLQIPASQLLSQMVRGELFVLNYLDAKGNAVHPKELSEKMAVSSARIASLLKRLEEKNLIQRYTDANDNRQVIVQLTKAGKQRIQVTRAEVISYVSAMLENLGPEDAEAYIRIHKKIWKNYLEDCQGHFGRIQDFFNA